MIVKSNLKLMAVAKLHHHLSFWFRSRGRAPIGLRIGIWAGAIIVEAPLVWIVSVKINPISAITIVPPVFSPKSTTAWVGGFIIDITIRIDTRDKIQFYIIYQIFYFIVSVS